MSVSHIVPNGFDGRHRNSFMHQLPVTHQRAESSFLKLADYRVALAQEGFFTHNRFKADRLALINIDSKTHKKIASLLVPSGILSWLTHFFCTPNLFLSKNRAIFDKALSGVVANKIKRENKAARSQQKAQDRFSAFDRASPLFQKGFMSRLGSALSGVLSFFWYPFASKEIREVGVAHMQGRRPSMEDEHLSCRVRFRVGSSTKEAEVFGICDGHGGSSAATFAKKRFADFLEKAIKKHNPAELSDVGLFAAFKEAFLNLDAAYKGSAGTTMSMAIILDGNLWVCNLGDARTVLVEEGHAVQLSQDQKCGDEKYARGVRKRGGIITPEEKQYLKNGMVLVSPPRVEGILAIPRAMGDHAIVGCIGGRNCVGHAPKITKMPLPKAKAGICRRLVIACDGLWDVCSSAQAADFVEKNRLSSNKEIAEGLIHKAYNAGSGDNISALVISI